MNQPVNLQLYDPAFVITGSACESLSDASNWTGVTNDYASDAAARYSKDAKNIPAGDAPPFCSGDYFPGVGDLSTATLMTTSFALREQVDTLDPMGRPGAANAGTVDGVGNQPCIKQFTGRKVRAGPGQPASWSAAARRSAISGACARASSSAPTSSRAIPS